VRYDYRWLRVYRINNTTLVTYHNTSTYQNVTGTVGASYRVNDRLSFTANIGSAWRAPSVNELYIDGIHLSAASYEKGDSSLHSERSYDFTVSGKYESERFLADITLYDNIINGFIYARPSLTPITLISGTYPLFNYTQTDVNLKGIDAELRYKILRRLSLDSKISLVRGWNRTVHDWLIFMPADRCDNSIRLDMGGWGVTRSWYISTGLLTVLKQTRTPPNSDYVPPPNGYTLLNASLGFEWPWKKQQLNIDLAGYNLTNVAYRDYLNKFRYYADDLGINVVLRARLRF
jgi:iron complex outermembrane receptor protein